MRHTAGVTAFLALVVFFFTALSCHPKPAEPDELVVAVASNLGDVFQALSRDYEKQTGTRITLSVGATLNLAQQLRHGAPFDLFVSADRETPLKLSQEGHLIPESVTVYARGQLVVWTSPSNGFAVEKLDDLLDAGITRIGVASPQVAPYGKAAQEALEAVGLWKQLLPKVVFGAHVKHVQQYAASGNVEAAFLPSSLVASVASVSSVSSVSSIGGRFFPVDARLYSPLDQALGVVASSTNQEEAQRLADFIGSPRGQAFLKGAGYQVGAEGKP